MTSTEPTDEHSDGEQATAPRRRVGRAVALTAVVAVAAAGIGGVAITQPGSPTAVVAVAHDRGSGGAAGGATRQATAAEQVGVVDIDTVLDYGAGRAAGTGIVLTPNGEILTNNHVVQDSTGITVTVVATGATYTASVVGTDAGDDVAVLSLAGASGLTPAVLSHADALATVAPGTSVTAVGNAGGTGGTPTAAPGNVVALGQEITASDETGANPEQLSGLIEVSAAIEAGDSGGPLYAGGSVIGIDTAASTQGPSMRTTARRSGATATEGFAIPIDTALGVARRITSGEESDAVQQGTPAFLGVQIAGQPAESADGVVVAGIVPGSPAATAGLAEGDVVTAIGGSAVSTPAQVSAAITAHGPGDRVQLAWTDSSGADRSATVVLTAGPAR